MKTATVSTNTRDIEINNARDFTLSNVSRDVSLIRVILGRPDSTPALYIRASGDCPMRGSSLVHSGLELEANCNHSVSGPVSFAPLPLFEPPIFYSR